MDRIPVLTEQHGICTVRWFVNPPAAGMWFQVTREEWSADLSTRDIYGWRLSSRSMPVHLKHTARSVNCGDFTLVIEPYIPWEH